MAKKFLVTSKKVRKEFDRINNLIFNNTLKPWKRIYIKYSNKNWGICLCYDDGHTNLKITTMFPDEKTFIELIAHEMIHVWQWSIGHNPDLDHDYGFNKWENEFAIHGIKLKICF